MLNIRIIVLLAVLMSVVAGATYFAASASASASSDIPTCPVVHPASYTSEALWDILNGRYERRVGLPR